MDPIAGILAGLLRGLSRYLPERRRDWGEAVLAEAVDVPAGPARWQWLAGGLWLVAWEAGVVRRLGYTVAAVGAGALLVWLDWHPGSTNPAMPTNRLTMIGVVLLLAGLPWLLRPVFGPVADNQTAFYVRVGGYLLIYGLMAVMVALSRYSSARFDYFVAVDQAHHDAEMRSGAVVSAVLMVGVVGGYATAILALTSRRAAIAPRTLALGTVFGVLTALVVYGLNPFGNPLHPDSGALSVVYRVALLLLVVIPGAPVLAGLLTARARSLRDGAIAGLLVGCFAAVLLHVLTVATMLLLPRHVDLIWANPDPHVAHGTSYELRMTVGDTATKYEVALLLGPLAGLALGALGGLSSDERRAPAPRARVRVASGGPPPPR